MPLRLTTRLEGAERLEDEMNHIDPIRGDIDDALLNTFPRIRLDADNAAFYQGLMRHELHINRCDDCQRWHHPPRSICPGCWSGSIRPSKVAGEGTVALVTVLRQGRREPGVDFSDGFALVAIELDEQIGLRLTGTVVGLPAAEVAVGQRVRTIWRDIEGRAPRADFEVIG